MARFYETVDFIKAEGREGFEFIELAVDEPEIGPAHEKEIITFIPATYEICSRCGGRGKHDHPAFSNGITSSEWAGPDWDDDSRENYLRGIYDVVCESCDGLRVELVPDVSRLPEDVAKRFDEYLDDRRRDAAEARHEREMGY